MPDQALPATWGTRELPLWAALRRLDAGEDFPELQTLRS